MNGHLTIGKLLFSASTVCAVMLGCSTVEQAREAQDVAARVVAPDFNPSRAVPNDFRLSALVDFALTNRPSVVSSRLAVEDSRLALKQIAAGAPLLSSTPWNALDVSVSAGYSEASPGTTASEGDFRTDGGPSAALSLDILVYDFGRNAAEARAQAERVIAAEEAYIQTSYSAFSEVANSVLTCREAMELLSVAETNAVAAAAHLEQSEHRAEQGEVQKLDVLKARLTLSQAQEKLVSASNAVETARADLAYAVGCVKGDRAELPRIKPEMRQMLATVVAPDDPSEAALVAYALKNAPSVKIARARVRAASEDVDRAVADLYPTVSASTSLSWSDPLWFFRWGFSGAQSLFTGFRKTTAVDRARVALESARAALDDTTLSLARDLEIALAARVDAKEATLRAEKTRHAAEENFALVSQQYEIGEADRVEFADALKALTEARGDVVKAETIEQKAEVALSTIAGIPPVYRVRGKDYENE